MITSGNSWHDYRNSLPRNILQGEFEVSTDPKIYFSTVLGSCVAVCLYDPGNGVGGMNHILLPGSERDGGGHSRYGVHLMELLINGVLRVGGNKPDLLAKVFGGGHVTSHPTQIGQKNGEFVMQFLAAERIQCVSDSLGGLKARKVQFVPCTGLARQLFIDPPRDLRERELTKKAVEEPASEITLF